MQTTQEKKRPKNKRKGKARAPQQQQHEQSSGAPQGSGARSRGTGKPKGKNVKPSKWADKCMYAELLEMKEGGFDASADLRDGVPEDIETGWVAVTPVPSGKRCIAVTHQTSGIAGVGESLLVYHLKELWCRMHDSICLYLPSFFLRLRREGVKYLRTYWAGQSAQRLRRSDPKNLLAICGSGSSSMNLFSWVMLTAAYSAEHDPPISGPGESADETLPIVSSPANRARLYHRRQLAGQRHPSRPRRHHLERSGPRRL